MAHLTPTQILVVKNAINLTHLTIYRYERQIEDFDNMIQKTIDEYDAKIQRAIKRKEKHLAEIDELVAECRELWGPTCYDWSRPFWVKYYDEIIEELGRTKESIIRQINFYKNLFITPETIPNALASIGKLENILTDHESVFPSYLPNKVSQPPKPFEYWSDYWEAAESWEPPFTPPYPEVEWDAPVTSPDTSKRGRCFRPWPCGKGYTRIWCIPCSES